MPLVDLTGPLEPGMWRYDHIPPVEIALVSTIDSHGSEAHSFQLATISGTYLETAAHLFHGQPTIDQVPLERFFCDAALLRLGALPPAQAIAVADLERAAQDVAIAPGDALLVDTGWERMWNAPAFIDDSPYFTMDAMRWIVARQPSILGGNMPCFDNPRGGAGVNKVLFGRGGLILAPLVNLASLTRSRFRLTVLPLKIRGVCGTPCRAIAAYD